MMHDGYVKFFWLPTVANEEAPTLAEITAGTQLTKFTGYSGLAGSENEVDTSDVDSTYDTSDIGTSKVGPVQITFKYDENEEMIDLLVFRSTGYLLRSRGGTIAAGEPIEVYPARIGQQRPEDYARNTEQKFSVNFHVYREPTPSASIAAP